MSYARSNNYFASDKWREYRDEVKRRAYGNWDQILLSLAPEGLTAAVSAGGRHVSCPRHGGTDGFRMFNDFRLTGGSVCNTCGTHADGFASLQWLYGWTFSEAVRAVGDVVGVQHYRDDNSNSPRPAARSISSNHRRRSRLSRLPGRTKRRHDAWLKPGTGPTP